jgi:hypothetical protein
LEWIAVPAQAGIRSVADWIPAFAGMTSPGEANKKALLVLQQGFREFNRAGQ